MEERFYPECKFGGYADIDATIVFFTRVNALLDKTHTVLDIGCGRGASFKDALPFRRDLMTLKGKAAKVIGIDVDEAGQKNNGIDEFKRFKVGEAWPVDDDSVDLCLSDNVLEHVEDVELFFSEAARVLKTGGRLCIRTPNLWSYFGLCSKLIPNKSHAKALEKAQINTAEEDVFPTLYKCNSIRRLRKMMKKHGFDAVVYGYEASPQYFNFSKIIYWLGVMHQKLAPKFLHMTLFAFGELKSKRD